jgi:hypothetical protein
MVINKQEAMIKYELAVNARFDKSFIMEWSLSRASCDKGAYLMKKSRAT